MKPIETDSLTIHFNGRTCIHARRCVLGLPGVFVSDEKPWIRPEGADPDAIVRVIEACPSGALSYERKDGADETPPRTNTVRLWENGPLQLHGDLRIEGQAPRTRALLCRCGRTGNPPFCDNSHRGEFEATSLVPEKPDRDQDVESRDGPLEIEAKANGPLRIRGDMEIIGGDGHRIARRRSAVLCRCGGSGEKPFCDGSHNGNGFEMPGTSSG